MTAPTAYLDAAALLGIPVEEVADVGDSPAGELITTTDGNTYVVVTEDNPDAEGKTGIMFLSAPSEQYGGTFPIYGQPSAAEPVTATEAVAVDDPNLDLNRDDEVANADEYPGGKMSTVLAWVQGDAERATIARDDELAQSKPRGSLLEELDAILAQAPVVEDVAADDPNLDLNRNADGDAQGITEDADAS